MSTVVYKCAQSKDYTLIKKAPSNIYIDVDCPAEKKIEVGGENILEIEALADLVLVERIVILVLVYWFIDFSFCLAIHLKLLKKRELNTLFFQGFENPSYLLEEVDHMWALSWQPHPPP